MTGFTRKALKCPTPQIADLPPPDSLRRGREYEGVFSRISKVLSSPNQSLSLCLYLYLSSASFLHRESLFTEARFCANQNCPFFVYFPKDLDVNATSFREKKNIDPGGRAPQSDVFAIRNALREKAPLVHKPVLWHFAVTQIACASFKL